MVPIEPLNGYIYRQRALHAMIVAVEPQTGQLQKKLLALVDLLSQCFAVGVNTCIIISLAWNNDRPDSDPRKLTHNVQLRFIYCVRTIYLQLGHIALIRVAYSNGSVAITTLIAV